MKDEPNEEIDELKKVIDKTAQDLKKGLLSGFQKFKKNVEAGLENSNIQEALDQGDMEKIASSGETLGKAVMKGAVEGISEVLTNISASSKSVMETLNTKKTKKQDDSDFDSFDDYEVIDEE